MNNLILRLVQIAISLAQTQVNGDDIRKSLLGVIQQGVQAYEDHTGEHVDIRLIRSEEPL